MSRRAESLYVRDIKEAIEAIFAYTKDVAFDDFKHDRMRCSAVIREFEIIGEAVGRHDAQIFLRPLKMGNTEGLREGWPDSPASPGIWCGSWGSLFLGCSRPLIVAFLQSLRLLDGDVWLQAGSGGHVNH